MIFRVQRCRQKYRTGIKLASNSLSKIQSEYRMTQLKPETWVEEYGDYLFRYAYSRLRESNAAEEVVQETFLAGVRYSEQYAGRGSERGWLMGILKRKIIDFIRARAKHGAAGSSGEDDWDPSSQLFDATGNWKNGALNWDPDRKLQSEELRGIVQDCLKSIPKKQADVFVLSVMEEMDSEKICKELGISASNMWVRMHRARLGLAKCVGEKWGVAQEIHNVR